MGALPHRTQPVPPSKRVEGIPGADRLHGLKLLCKNA